jgi:exosortase
LTISVLTWWRPILVTGRLALTSEAHTYILLIVPLSILLIYLRHAELPSSSSRNWVGWSLMAAAIVIRATFTLSPLPLHPDDNLWLTMSALVVWWIGTTIACFGIELFRCLQFELCFLFLTAALPNVVVNWATEGLQVQSAVATSLLFRLIHVPVARQGVLLSIPGLDIEVARECSSIRSSSMLILITLILAQLFLRARWRKLLLIAIAFPLSIAKNAVRIVTLGELGTRWDPGYLHGRLHHDGGIIFLGFAVLIELSILWVLAKSEMQAAARQ